MLKYPRVFEVPTGLADLQGIACGEYDQHFGNVQSYVRHLDTLLGLLLERTKSDLASYLRIQNSSQWDPSGDRIRPN